MQTSTLELFCLQHTQCRHQNNFKEQPRGLHEFVWQAQFCLDSEILCTRQAALERQDLSCTHLAHHELESVFYYVTIVMIINNNLLLLLSYLLLLLYCARCL